MQVKCIRYRTAAPIAVLLYWVSTSAAYGQTPPETAVPETAVPATETTSPKQSDANKSSEATKQSHPADKDTELKALTERLDKLEALDAEQSEKILELKVQGLQSASIKEQAANSERITFYGFFDTSFQKYFMKKNTSLKLYVPEKSFFSAMQLNLYTSATLTNTLSFLSEIRFSFLPQGMDETLEYAGIPKAGLPSEGIFGNEYTRVNTLVTDPTTTFQFHQGGLTIERAHLTYSPKEWFSILVGRFLTPFGIWNIDHGSPVVLTTVLPYLIIRRMMPPAQTGLQISGRVFPTNDILLDYAVTLSNGRGPIAAYSDFDENKALGLKLKFTYRARDFFISLGTYGYVGKETDNKKVVHILGLPNDATEEAPLLVETVETESFNEYSVSSDLLVEAFGIRLQAEYAFRYQKQLINALVETQYALFAGASPLDQIFKASNRGHDFYVLAAYTLPLQRWLHTTAITPYFMFEYARPMDTFDLLSSDRYVAGLNIKPSPNITLKLEGLYVNTILDLVRGDVYGFHTQVAVSF